jgi:hypothetical protein
MIQAIVGIALSVLLGVVAWKLHRLEDGLVGIRQGFRHLELIVGGAIKQRENIELDLAAHASRIRSLEEWRTEFGG